MRLTTYSLTVLESLAPGNAYLGIRIASATGYKAGEFLCVR